MTKKAEHAIPNERLKHARELHNWTQGYVEEQLGVSQGQVSRWERGIEHPGVDNQAKLCALYRANSIELGLVEQSLPPPHVKRSLHLPEQPFPPIWNVPYEPDPLFTGRDQLLDQLHTSLLSHETTVLTQVISGLGGVGKTQLAVEYCYRYRGAYKAVVWIHADSPDTVMESLTEIARLLKLPGRKTRDQQSLRHGIREWMQTKPHWLLVLDNLEDIHSVGDLLSPARRGHVLMTTRSQFTGKYPKIDVQDLSTEDGAWLVLRKAHILAPTASFQEAEESDREAARQVALTLGGLPLALEQAGAYIEETGCTPSQYLERYHTQRAVLLQRRGEMGEQSPHPEAVTITFQMSLDKIERVNSAATALLRLCAFLAPDAIPIDLFIRNAPALSPTLQNLVAVPERLNEAIILIRRYSLLHFLRKRQAVGIHRVVQAVIQDDLEAKGQRTYWETSMVAVITKAFMNADSETIFTDYDPYLPHALAAATVLHRHVIVHEPAGHLLFLLGHYLTRHARYEQAESVCQDALWLYQQLGGSVYLGGPIHREVGIQLTNLAHVYEEKREHHKAQALFEQALSICTQISPCQLFDVAIAFTNLARCFRFQGHLVEAKKRAQKALALFKLAAATASHAFATALMESANVAREQGKFQDAEQLYQQAQHIYEGTLAPDHPFLGHCFEAQGANHFLQHHFDQAEAFLWKALAIFEHRWGKNHPDVASCLNHLAEVSLMLGRLEQAEELNKRALAIYERVGGSEYLEISQPLQGLAMQYILQERYAEAEPLCKRAIAIIEKSQGPEHPELISALEIYAKLRLFQTEVWEAKELFKRAEAIEQKHLREHSGQEYEGMPPAS